MDAYLIIINIQLSKYDTQITHNTIIQ